MEYYIHGINGPVITVRGGRDMSMMDMVYVGHQRILGEVVEIEEGDTIVQVYEDTSELKHGEPVECSKTPMSIDLGPGLLDNIFDGIARPLKKIESLAGPFITRGLHMSALDEEKDWDIDILISNGDTVHGGQIFATCAETSAIRHKCMVPPHVSGTVKNVQSSGRHRVKDIIATVTDSRGHDTPLTICQTWPIRTPRPTSERLSAKVPLITGQRVIDTLFPISKGGCASIPGPFGAGKTMVQHQLAKWSDADIIVYLGCGERGNEMTQALEEFSELKDPKTDKPLMERTILIANTSNMPVAAREASIYTGMTIAEYYRDMGYDVALMADSTSRWAEALREISGRLEEMPAEESFPAYLPSRLAGFYERAGVMKTLSDEQGSVTIIGAVSPQGGDFSEPVTQATKRFTRCFWALDRSLAYARHFPSINWLDSYSEYIGELSPWYNEHLGPEFVECSRRIKTLLNEESSLQEIAKLIGTDILPDDQKLVIEVAKVIKVGFLQQNAFHRTDTYMVLKNQLNLMRAIFHLYDRAKELTRRNIPLSQLLSTGIFESLLRLKFELGDNPDRAQDVMAETDTAVSEILKSNF